MEDNKLFNDTILQFKEWLKNVKHYGAGTISSRVSNVKTLGENYDLLDEYSKDSFLSLFDELTFSRSDSEPKTTLPIKGDYYNGLATYRQALKLFASFLGAIQFVAPQKDLSKSSIFIGNFEDIKKYVGPKCRNEVNIFCKAERVKHKGICEYCGEVAILDSAHVVERPIIMKNILEDHYRKGPDYYEVNLDDFFIRFREAHFPIQDHIFFLCKKCHNKLDKTQEITITDIKNKRGY